MSGNVKHTLISAVFARKAIWDQRHKDHHNRFRLEKLWMEVARICGITTTEAKKKWKILRQQFKGKWERIPKPNEGDPDFDDEMDWPYFQTLRFLCDTFQCGKKSGKLKSCNPDENGVAGESNIDTNEDDPLSTSMHNTTALSTTPQPTTRSITPSSSIADDSPGYNKRASLLDSIGSQIVELKKEKLKMRQEKQSQLRHQEDEDIAFFTSLLPHVRRMDTLSKMMFRIDVQKLVMDRAYGVAYGSVSSASTKSTHNPSTEQHMV